MKSAFFVTIFVIVGGVAILRAFPAEDKRATLEFRQAMDELGLPPQIEDDVAVTEHDLAVIPEPVVAQFVAQWIPLSASEIFTFLME